MVNPDRLYVHRSVASQSGPVIYWMSRDQRVSDNWSLHFALQIATEKKVQMSVVFCLVPEFLGAGLRQYSFMIKGLKKVCSRLQKLNIPFYLLKGDPVEELGRFIDRYRINHVVCDFDPLKIKRNWIDKIKERNDINLTEVDSHNIVPCRKASTKMEFGAYTLRPKIKKLLQLYLDRYPSLKPQVFKGEFRFQNIEWEDPAVSLKNISAVSPVNWIDSGEDCAVEMLNLFLKEKLGKYASDKNDPNLDGTSNLSPYFHFGQLSPQRVALEIITNYKGTPDSESYLEELIVRRELSDNFCFYNPDYDNYRGFPEWSKASLNAHRMDEREYLYTPEDFENAKTHDPLWNAAQVEMATLGKMHGYMRMYWAKKILEWTSSPEEALAVSIYLNDKYQLDGRDPNGYTGCAWSIGGVHDRAWSERPVFGKIRYMNYNGCLRKFDVRKYISKWSTD